MDTNMILQMIANMQQNAQNNLPVTPNNGNPAGANNMPSSADNEPSGQGTGVYPWLQPSQSMDFFHQMLRTTGGNQPAQIVPVQHQVPNMSTNDPAHPVPAVLPGNTGIVPPGFNPPAFDVHGTHSGERVGVALPQRRLGQRMYVR